MNVLLLIVRLMLILRVCYLVAKLYIFIVYWLLGYEGDSSDSEDGHSLMSFSNAHLLRPLLPNFWLILSLDSTDSVHVYLHARDDEAMSAAHDEHVTLFEQVIDHIERVCHQVNQVRESRSCHVSY